MNAYNMLLDTVESSESSLSIQENKTCVMYIFNRVYFMF